MKAMAVKKTKRKQNLRFKNAVAGYLFILPFILGFLCFMLYPMLDSIRMSFSTVEVNTGAGYFNMTFAGLENYRKAFLVDREFRQLLVGELKGLIEVPAILIFSFFVAMLLNQKFKCRGFIRAIFFLPVILSSGVLVGLEYSNTLLQGMEEVIKEESQNNSITSTLEDILMSSDMFSGYYDFLFQIVNKIYDIAISSGIQIIIFLSGLQTISPSMYEAAQIEGCTAWESFWKITFPMVSSLILVNVVYTIVDFFVRTDNEVMQRISKETLNMKYDFSSAMAWSYFACVILILAIVYALISRLVYYYE